MFGTLISSVTVGAGGASSISFSSIPQTYTDLTLVVSGRGANAYAAGELLLTFNGSSAAIYTTRWLQGYNGSATSTSGINNTAANTGPAIPGNNATASTFGNSIFVFPNYTSTTVNKTFSGDGVTENNSALAGVAIVAGLWADTAAITSISVATNSGGNFMQYSTAYLYGTLKGSGGATAS